MTAAAAGLLLGVLALGSGAGEADEPAVDSRALRGRGARGALTLSEAIRTVGTTRTAQFYTVSGNESASVDIVAAWELEVRAITIYAGNNDSDPLTGPRGEVRIIHDLQDPGTGVTVQFFGVEKNGATHYTFPAGLSLRENDEIQWRPRPGASAAELIQISLHGTVPVTATGAMVR